MGPIHREYSSLPCIDGVLASLNGVFPTTGEHILYVMTDGKVAAYGGYTKDIALRKEKHRQNPVNYKVAGWFEHLGSTDIVHLIPVGRTDDPDTDEKRLISALRRLGGNLNIDRGGDQTLSRFLGLGGNRGFLAPGLHEATVTRISWSTRQTREGEKAQFEMLFEVNGIEHATRIVIGGIGSHNRDENRRNNRARLTQNCRVLLDLDRDPTVEEMKRFLQDGLTSPVDVVIECRNPTGRTTIGGARYSWQDCKVRR